jgi:hypothetical protein
VDHKGAATEGGSAFIPAPRHATVTSFRRRESRLSINYYLNNQHALYDNSSPTANIKRSKTERNTVMNNVTILIANLFPFVTPEKPINPKKKLKTLKHKLIING